MTKKFLLATFFGFFTLYLSPQKVLAQQLVCVVLESDPPLGEDRDPSLLDLTPVAYDPDNPYVDFPHPTDPKAPQLSTLIEGNSRPRIVGAYLIDGSNIPSDAPPGFANFVSFEAGNNNIRLPRSGYSLSGGVEAMVLHADSNSLTIKYTAEDSIVSGYTLYLEGINVRPEILSAYQQANADGRTELPVLGPAEVLGTAIDGTISVGIRDTGMWMDPRWLGDWWLITGFPPIEGTAPVCWGVPEERRQNTCPNMEVGYIPSCGEGFVLKVPELVIPFLGNIAQLIFPEIENMPSWLRKWAKYERENPIDRLHPPQESDEAEELFRIRMEETAWTDSRTYYAWYDLATGEGGTTEGNPEYPETSNNALRPPYKTTGYLWGLMRPPSQGNSMHGMLENPSTLTFEGVKYPINLTQTAGEQEGCSTEVTDITSTGNSVSFTAYTTGAVQQFKDLWYEVTGPKGKTNCSNVLKQAGNTDRRVTCNNLAYEDGTPLNPGDVITITVTSPQAWEECEDIIGETQIKLGENKPGEGGGGSSPPGCAIYGVSGSPQEQPCIAGSCQLPTNVAYQLFEEIFNAVGELVERIPSGWATTAHEILFVPQLLYPKNLVGVYKNGTAVYNSLLPPGVAESAPEPAIAEANKHKVDLGPFQITTLFQSRHKVPMIGRPYLEKKKFMQFLEPPNQTTP